MILVAALFGCQLHNQTAHTQITTSLLTMRIRRVLDLDEVLDMVSILLSDQTNYIHIVPASYPSSQQLRVESESLTWCDRLILFPYDVCCCRTYAVNHTLGQQAAGKGKDPFTPAFIDQSAIRIDPQSI
jgi:hypothetical protein